MTNYDQAVTEARTLVRRSEEDQWRLAELTWQALHEHGKTTRQWAVDIDASKDTAHRWSRIWDKYRLSPRETRPAFRDAFAEAKGLPIDPQDRRDMEADANLRRAAPERKIEIANALLDDVQVQEAVLPRISQFARSMPDQQREDLAYEITSDASRERQQEYSRNVRANEAARKPIGLEIVSDVIAINNRLEQLVRKVADVSLSDDIKQSLRNELVRVRDNAAHIEAALASPSMDDELQAILRAGL